MLPLDELRSAILNNETNLEEYLSIANTIANCMVENVNEYKVQHGKYEQKDIFIALQTLIQKNFFAPPTILDILLFKCLQQKLEETNNDGISMKFVSPLTMALMNYDSTNSDKICDFFESLPGDFNQLCNLYYKCESLHRLCVQHLINLSTSDSNITAVPRQREVVVTLKEAALECNLEKFTTTLRENHKLLSNNCYSGKTFIQKVQFILLQLKHNICAFFQPGHSSKSFTKKATKISLATARVAAPAA